jgi:hypothetical protein
MSSAEDTVYYSWIFYILIPHLRASSGHYPGRKGTFPDSPHPVHLLPYKAELSFLPQDSYEILVNLKAFYLLA